ncbi:MAG: Rha family transcriptional regulator [Pseudomonadota bacterium]
MAEKQKLVKDIDGGLVAESQTLAAKFGCSHTDILDAIERIDCTPEFRSRNFVQFASQDGFAITRDGFAFLMVELSGPRVSLWAEDFIDAFSAPAQIQNYQHSA